MGTLQVVDYSNSFKGCISAEGLGPNILILRKLERRIRRFDGKLAGYELEYRWCSVLCEHSNDEAWSQTLGQEFTYFRYDEIDIIGIEQGEVSLFEAFDLV